LFSSFYIASSSSSTSNNSNFLTTTTNTSGSSAENSNSGSLSPQQQQQQQIQQQSIDLEKLKNENNASFIEQLIQQNQHLILNNNKFTLSRNNQMFDNTQSPKPHNKYLTNRFGTMNNHLQQQQQQQLCQYVDLNGQLPNPPVLPPPSMATTAYLVQTPNGSALLIPPQTALNPTNHFIQTNSSTLQQQQNNTFSLNRNPYGLTTIPLQTNNTLSNTTTTTTLPNSVSINNPNCFNRPDSTASTNVYQTIDTEK